MPAHNSVCMEYANYMLRPCANLAHIHTLERVLSRAVFMRVAPFALDYLQWCVHITIYARCVMLNLY